ncbi:hypothetical protein GE061_018676 [Apolygus lucorum]|uniref:DUF7041 domain-containing protein n=1 Tax=Apolygus lucorum TaxID=248454 RepID=A0A8S9XEP6_APOLU|nr:hypothetical protein GE061_018676 [Apolygus lucorum]
MATGTSKSDSDESGNRGEQIARISIKIPPLWRRNVKVWRLQVDAQFANSPVTQELTKYNYVLASLDGDVAELISDLLLKPLSNTPYTDLMTRLQTEFEISEGRKVPYPGTSQFRAIMVVNGWGPETAAVRLMAALRGMAHATAAIFQRPSVICLQRRMLHPNDSEPKDKHVGS